MYLRLKVKLGSGKRSLFPKAYRVLRPEKYRPLPDGWCWPPTPYQSDFSHPKKKKRKKRIPQEVLDEWRGFSRRRPEADSSASTSSGAQPAPRIILEPDGTLQEDPNDAHMEDTPDDDSAHGEVDLGPPLGLDDEF